MDQLGALIKQVSAKCLLLQGSEFLSKKDSKEGDPIWDKEMDTKCSIIRLQVAKLGPTAEQELRKEPIEMLWYLHLIQEMG